LGEFGEERRNLTPIKDIPKVMTDAVLAIEDARFYSTWRRGLPGRDARRPGQPGRLKSQGASTITMQVARNVYLSSEKTYTRKIYEILLTFKLEHLLTKDQILEIYMNQIFLGNRAYGFAAAVEAYFGKPLKDITIAEAAMLAGLPKAPSAYNPISNPSGRAFAPALHHRPHGGKRLHHRGPGAGGQGTRTGLKAQQRRQPSGPRRICGGNGAPADARPVRRRDLHPRPECLHHAQGRRPGTPPTRPCARASWISSAARSTAAPRSSSRCPPMQGAWKTPSTRY
jgi:hypothetical protein